MLVHCMRNIMPSYSGSNYEGHFGNAYHGEETSMWQRLFFLILNRQFAYACSS